MRLAGIPKIEKPFEQPSSKTLNVGAPTFSALATGRGSFIPPSSLSVGADFQIGSSSVLVWNLVDLQTGYYTNQSCDPAVAR
jgi:hypothetical protein